MPSVVRVAAALTPAVVRAICAAPVDAAPTLPSTAAAVAACCSSTTAMSRCAPSIRPMISAMSEIARTACSVSDRMVSTRRVMSSVARAVSCASSLTSFATTAKPRPASPARAASMVAFSARRLVCAAIELTTATTPAISSEETPSWATVRVVDRATVDRAGGDVEHLGAAGAIERTDELSSWEAAAASSTLAAT